MPKLVKRIPKAKKTQAALRNLGYDFNASVADLIDNSIAANATTIELYFFRKNGGYKLFVLDNGCGMDRKQLSEAITYGSDVDYGKNSLGKFGMGLKTASLAHCDKLYVFSKKSLDDKFIGTGIDTKIVEEEDEWWTIDFNQNECFDIISDYIPSYKKMSTIVMWDEICLIDKEYLTRDDEMHKINFHYKLIKSLENHLGMVFHCFFDGTKNYKKTKISMKINRPPFIFFFNNFCINTCTNEFIV